jgi:type VI secretion system protein ImpC
MSVKEQVARQETEALETSQSVYERLCSLADIEPLSGHVSLDRFSDAGKMADAPKKERVTAGLKVFLHLLAGPSGKRGLERIDKGLLDEYIAQVDGLISAQLDEVLHHSEFQRVEAAWRSLKFLVDRCDFRSNVKVELLDATKEDLQDDFEDAPDTTQSGLYRHIYVQEYDTPGGEPISAVISNYEFEGSMKDITLLTEISRVSASCHCPFIGGVGAAFFGKESVSDLPKINDMASYMDKAEFIRWNAFRETEDARYVGLTLPRFLLRLPYGEANPVRTFNYAENAVGEDSERYLWGNAAFAFAANMAASFKRNGWAVNIRGPESGGKVEGLPVHQYDIGQGLQTKIPTEFIISETRELEYANLGFIPLSYYKNSDYACFFSANSVQKPAEYSTAEATANSRINARLPYIFLVSRISHYLKVLQRENIGAAKPRQELENELNDWLQTLVTKMKDPDAALIATHPLRDGQVTVSEIADNPGFYAVNLFVMPHFQIEGVNVRLSLVAQMPKETA